MNLLVVFFAFAFVLFVSAEFPRDCLLNHAKIRKIFKSELNEECFLNTSTKTCTYEYESSDKYQVNGLVRKLSNAVGNTKNIYSNKIYVFRINKRLVCNFLSKLSHALFILFFSQEMPRIVTAWQIQLNPEKLRHTVC